MLILVTAVAAYRFWPATAGGPARTSNVASGSRGAARPGQDIVAPDVHLEALQGEKPRPGEAERDLFRFKQQTQPPQPGELKPAQPGPQGSAPPAAGASEAGAPPPISLKFIGVVTAPEQNKTIAFLTDGRGVYEGTEGGVIEGRYRILKIGVESIDLAYLDGRGRQTIRMTGQ
jgi:hypothetical protein